MKKVVLFCLFFSIMIFLSASSGCLFLSINPSAISRSMGNCGGVADAWHQSPNVGWSNPALASVHDGLQIGYSHDAWFEEAGISDIYVNHSYANMTFRGIGVTIPLPNSIIKDRLQFGTTLDYGGMDRTDEENNDLGTFEAYETATKVTFAFNPMEYYKESLKETSFRAVDLHLGLTYNYVYSDLAPAGSGTPEYETKGNGSASSLDLGVLAKVNIHEIMNNDMFNLECSIGFSSTNVGNEIIGYGNYPGQADPLPNVNSQGFGLYASIPNRSTYLTEDLTGFIPNLFSIMYTNGMSKDENDDRDPETGSGIEIGIGDTFFYRIGKLEDRDGGLSGDSRGFGFRFNYLDYGTVEYNWAEFPGGSLTDYQRMEDWMINLNILKVIKILKNK